jgi:aminoglycoside phosphotransferase (APT) family kinase protein
LAAARVTQRIISGLTSCIPEFASGQLILRDCKPDHFRFKKGFWTGRYDLTVADPGSTDNRVISIEVTILPQGYPSRIQPASPGVFGGERWQAYLPELHVDLRMLEPETALASLKFLTDPEESRQFIEQGLRMGSSAYHDLRIQSCIPQVLRYKPGSRCTIRYQLEYPPEAATSEGVSHSQTWPGTIIAKTYRGEKGQIAYDSMRAIWESPLGRSQAVTVAEPLVYIEKEKVLLQGLVREEQTLKDLLRPALDANTQQSLEELNQYMRKTAKGIAELHLSGVRMGDLHTWEDERAEVLEKIENLAAAVPSLSVAGKPFLERLQTIADQIPPDSPVPSHGSFRPAQVLLYQGEISFIDFDSFCQAEPALDLGLFRCGMKSIALNQPHEEQEDEPWDAVDISIRKKRLTQVKALCETFQDEYKIYHPISRERVALWEALDLMMLVLNSWIKVQPERLKACMFLLEDHLHDAGL